MYWLLWRRVNNIFEFKWNLKSILMSVKHSWVFKLSIIAWNPELVISLSLFIHLFVKEIFKRRNLENFLPANKLECLYSIWRLEIFRKFMEVTATITHEIPIYIMLDDLHECYFSTMILVLICLFLANWISIILGWTTFSLYLLT